MILDRLQKARALLSKAGEYSESVKLSILLGEIIAFDRLGSLHGPMESLDQLKSIIYAGSECDDRSASSYEEDCFSSEDYEDFSATTSNLLSLISSTCSQEVGKELSLIVNRLFEEVHDQLYRPQPSCRGKYRDHLDNGVEPGSSVKQCRARHKAKLKKRINNIWRIVVKVWRIMRFIDDALDKKGAKK